LPSYIEQQTDYSGCTRFGGMTLVEVYGVWLEFQRRFPDRYVSAAKEETEAVLHELTQSTCACGNAAGVEQELSRSWNNFLDGFRNLLPASASINVCKAFATVDRIFAPTAPQNKRSITRSRWHCKL